MMILQSRISLAAITAAIFCLNQSSNTAVATENDATTVTTTQPLEKKWVLYHSFGDENDDWIRRGTVRLVVDPSKVGGGGGDTLNEDMRTKSITGKESQQPLHFEVDNDEGCLSEMSLQNLQNSAWYKLKLQEEEGGSSDDQAPQPRPVITTVSTCQLRKANFRDELVLTLGRWGHVISLAYQPLVSPLAPKSCDALPDLLSPNQDDDTAAPLQFTSRISYQTATPGMTIKPILPNYQPPPGLKLISKKKTVSESATADPNDAKNKNTPKDNTANNNYNPFGGSEEEDGKKQDDSFDASPFGFLKRYWYIILPLMIMNFMSSPEPPAPEAGGQAQQQQQQQQQGGQPPQSQQQQPRPAAQAIPPSSGGGTPTASQSKRRGKRG